MRANYRVTPWMAFTFSAVVLGICAYFLVDITRDTVAHVTADAQPATIVDIQSVGNRNGKGSSREKLMSFELRDGSAQSDEVRGRWLWWPSEGETIHVWEAAPGDWEVREDFSWVGTIGWTSALLIPWLIALAKVWEWAEKALFPERWAASQRRERERRRSARKDLKSTSKLSRRQRAKAQRPPSP